jgi:hypothetical protein
MSGAILQLPEYSFMLLKWIVLSMFALTLYPSGTGVLHLIQINHQPDSTNFQSITGFIILHTGCAKI